MINIALLPKAEVLKALHDGTQALGLGRLHDLGRDMTIKEAEDMIAKMEKWGLSLYFDYIYGRPLKVNITGDEFDERLYDRDAGEGQAQCVIDALYEKLTAPENKNG
jgi:hypothetical protein